MGAVTINTHTHIGAPSLISRDMFEVRQGAEVSVREHPWPHSSGPMCRFQAIDHGRNASPHGVPTPTEKTDLETRIERLCASLQSVLERSRTKERWSRRDKTLSTYTPLRQYFPQPYERDISIADMCELQNSASGA